MKQLTLAAMFFKLELADVITTNLALAQGNHEFNPLMLAEMHNLGACYFVPKLAIALIIAAMIWRFPPTKLYRYLVSALLLLCSAIVVNNLAVIYLS